MPTQPKLLKYQPLILTPHAADNLSCHKPQLLQTSEEHTVMDKSEVLYEAFKETYIQTRKVYFMNIMMGVFALLIILLVMRDKLLVQDFEPKTQAFHGQIEQIDQDIQALNNQQFTLPSHYRKARINYDKARLAVDSWHKDLPARKKMKEKYERYLSEYSGSHEKVMDRLTIDGEPGLDLFTSLQQALIKSTEASKAFHTEKNTMAKLKQQFKTDMTIKIASHENQKQLTQHKIELLRDDLNSILHDKTRIPWLGLRINPQDILAFIPILLMIFFHLLFDRFDDILMIVKKPQTEEIRDSLKEYPLSIFLGRRNLYGLITSSLMFAAIPVLQISALTLTYQNNIEIVALGPDSGIIVLGTGITAVIISLVYPVIVLRRHRQHVFS